MISTLTDTPQIIDGYVRLSRDDNKRNYSSIENQKKIIQQYAEENNMIIRHIYEDDGISGYSFNRPDFQKMMASLDTINVIVAKDLSRIGRHNAKVLLFLEEMEEMGKRVILIDDNYDSFYSDDDIIGIKTSCKKYKSEGKTYQTHGTGKRNSCQSDAIWLYQTPS
jgi:DNA invertase Pin-like site-specific DNA recombinase